MPTLLLKTEPSDYSFDDLLRDKLCTWDGVANPQARIVLRGARVNDEAIIYHTGDEKCIVGLARVVAEPSEDPNEPGTTPEGLPKAPVLKLKPLRAAKVRVTLAQIKGDARFASFALVKQARLSAMVVPPALDKALRTMAGL